MNSSTSRGKSLRLLARVAWRNIGRQRRRTLLTVGAMALGVAFCMATIALSDGMFADMFRILVRQNLGQVQVHAPAFPKQRALQETLPASVLGSLDGLPVVAGRSARLYGYALLGVGQKAAGGQLEGIVPADEDRVTRVASRVVTGRMLAEDSRHEIVLGAGLADNLDAAVGTEVVVITQAADGSLGNAVFTVVGVVRTGSVIFDRGGAFVHLADLQELLVLPDQLHELVLVTPPDDGAEALARAVAVALEGRGLLVRTWKQVNPQAAQILDLQAVCTGLVLFVVFSVAALGVLNTMLMSVFERTRELGVLRALGLRPGQMVALVLLESLVLAALASVLGLLLGLALDLFLVRWGLDLRWFMTSGTWSWGGLSIDAVTHGVIRPQGIVATLAGLVAVTVVAALWPALRAARIEPVVAMRQDG